VSRNSKQADEKGEPILRKSKTIHESTRKNTNEWLFFVPIRVISWIARSGRQFASVRFGLAPKTRIQLHILWFKAGVFGDTSQHLWTNLIFIMKSKDYIRPTGTGEDLVRAGFPFDTPANAKKRSKNTLRFS